MFSHAIASKWLIPGSLCLRNFHTLRLNSFARLLTVSAAEMSKPKVYFDMSAGGKKLGRIVMEVSWLASFFFFLLYSVFIDLAVS